MTKEEVYSNETAESISALVKSVGGDPSTLQGSLVSDMITSSLKMLFNGPDIGQLKLINRTLKEMRHAYSIFNHYLGARCISIFGSARTPEDHPDYLAAKEFSHAMSKLNWMCMTGAANGIMKAGLEGQSPESSFGLSIRLPFEVPTNSYIAGNPKLMIFKYFFVRKLMFMSHSDALAAFPGGFGTLDEVFEMLTLIQTGKAKILPIVLLEGEGGKYWNNFEKYVQEQLLMNGWISPEDQNLYYIPKSVGDAVLHVANFYKVYHSSRYVGENLVIRLNKILTEEQLAYLNEHFKDLIQNGSMRMGPSFEEETDVLNLPRLIFNHTKNRFGLLRKMIDEINTF